MLTYIVIGLILALLIYNGVRHAIGNGQDPGGWYPYE